MRIWKSNNLFGALLVTAVFCLSCAEGPEELAASSEPLPNEHASFAVRQANPVEEIHVMVALCDNESQGIVPVSKQLGDGDDPKTNLYRGADLFLKEFQLDPAARSCTTKAGNIETDCI